MRLLLLGLFCFIQSSVKALDVAPDTIELAYGDAIDRQVFFHDKRLELRWDWNPEWLSNSTWQANGYIAASASFLDGYADPNKNLVSHLPSEDKVQVYALAPVFRFYNQIQSSTRAFLDLGIGGSWFSAYRLEREGTTRQRLGGHGQFEIRAGFGVEFSRQLELGYRIIHYSNAGLNGTNMGLNVHMVTLGYHFR